MNSKRNKQIWAAINEVEKQFPFANYITLDAKYHTFNIVNSVLEVCGSYTNLKLLDIGCGPMNVTAVFAKCGFQCFAADDLLDQWHLADDNRSKIKTFARLMDIQFHLQDSTYYIPFTKGTFDVVLLNSVIEHLHESPRELLNEAFRFLKPEGIVVLTMPNSVNLRKRISVLFGRTNYPPVQGFYNAHGIWRGHVREYTLAETEYIVRQNGGMVILSKTFHLNIYSKIHWPLLRKIYIILTGIMPSLRDGVIVIARKPIGWTAKL
jgi:2-polyprenyl-3-methyl-5-hydroxy-6-metoxy-1,4-benzoquinol methylase